MHQCKHYLENLLQSIYELAQSVDVTVEWALVVVVPYATVT